MLKLIPYTKQLISVGNARHYEGQLVWSDGKVAYGWDYAPQQQTPAIPQSGGGFWVGEQLTLPFRYQLALKDLSLGSPIQGGITLSADIAHAYPAVATDESVSGPAYGYVYLNKKVYQYTGGLIYLDGQGRTVIYDNYAVHFYSFDNTRVTDINNYPLQIGNITIRDGSDNILYSGDECGYATDGDNIYVYSSYDTDMHDYSSPLATYINGVLTYDNYTGAGSITITDAYDVYEPTVVTVSLADLRNYDYMFFCDHWDANDTHYTVTQHLDSSDARLLFQLAKHDSVYVTAETLDRDADGDILYSGTYTIHYEAVIAQGPGTVVESGNTTYAYDSGGNVVARCTSADIVYIYVNGTSTFAGYGRIVAVGNEYSVRIYPNGKSGTGHIEYDNGNKIITDLNGNPVATQDGSNIYYYFRGVLAYYGPGIIQLTGTPTESAYEGDYTVLSDDGTYTKTGYGRIVYQYLPQSGDVSVYNATTGDLIAFTDRVNGDVTVYDAYGNVEFFGQGTITVTNLTPVQWLCNWRISAITNGSGDIVIKNDDVYVTGVGYEDGEDIVVGSYDDAGWIETSNLVPYESTKSYHITPSGVSVQAYPQSFSIGNGAELRFTGITDIALAFGQTVISNDPLGLLVQPDPNTHKIVCPGGVYSYGKYILSREDKKIWNFNPQTPQSQVYQGIGRVFSLAWLKRVWKV